MSLVWPALPRWTCASLNPGKMKVLVVALFRSRRTVWGPASRVTSSLVPDGQHFAVCDGHGLHDVRLVFGESFAGVDDAVEEDQVRSRGWFRMLLDGVPGGEV